MKTLGECQVTFHEVNESNQKGWGIWHSYGTGGYQKKKKSPFDVQLLFFGNVL